jgi:uncharacterized protein YjiS (DUF1127 family)
MATTHIAGHTGAITTWFENILSGLARGMTAYIEARSRAAEFEALNARTDEELAEMGLTRDDIPRHVFRDMYGI